MCARLPRHVPAVFVLIAALWITLVIHVCEGESPGDGLRGPIFVSEPPSHVTIPNSKGAVIPCSVYGNPAPLVTWVTADGNDVVVEPGVIEILHNHSLLFYAFQSSHVRPSVHTQTYRCMAENRVGKVLSRKVQTVAVIVEELESFTVNVRDVWVMRGGTAIFKCEINPSYTKDFVNITGWNQGTRDIHSGGRFSITAQGDLHVRDVRDTDGNTDFRCTATSFISGIQKLSSYAKLLIHDPPAGGKTPTIDVDPFQSKTTGVGDTVELTCVANGWPLPTYRWYKNATQLNVTGTRFTQYGGHLVIKDARTADSGEYRCNASNHRGSDIAVRILNVKAPLVAAIDPGFQRVDSGQVAIFNCSITVSRLNSVVWYKDGAPLVPKTSHVYRSDTVLEIRDIVRADQGMYQCFASDGNDETQAAAQLLLGAARPTILGFGSQFVQKGQRASVRCITSGNPTPTLRWQLDGQTLQESSHVSVGDFLTSSGDVISYVNISSVTLLDGGDYRCLATNDAGVAEHISRLNVYGGPYIREMTNVTATAHERLRIKCYVTGYPMADVTWHRDNRQLPLNHLQQVVNGTLTILKVQKDYDVGKYTCRAVNSNGRDARNVFVSVVEPPVIDPFRIPERKQGDRVTLSCAVSSGDLPIHIDWTKDGLPIPPDIGIIVKTSGSYSSLLRIDDVSPKHNGNYTCHAHNKAANTSYTALLHVDVPPRWSVEPEDTFVIRKNSVYMDCAATGIPEPKITWSENQGGFPAKYVALNLGNSDDYHVFENGTLLLRSADEAHDGFYLCRADNNIGHGISKIVYLKVHVPARFDISVRNYSVLYGHNISLACQALGDKPLSVSWNFKNTTVGRGNFGSRYTVSVSNTTRGMLSQLTVHPAQRSDTGQFTCAAANQFGSDFTTIYLTVLEPPDAPGNLSLVEKGSRYVVLIWQTSFDGNSPLLQYVIEYQNNSGESRGHVNNITVSGDATTATVPGLHPSFTYDIRIRGRNAVGLGLTSHQISAKLLEEAPNGPPTDVKATALGSQKLQVKWKPPALEKRNGVILRYYVSYKETQMMDQLQVITREINPDKDDPETEISVVISNLKKFTEYMVHVKSFNKEGQGPASAEVKVTTLEDVPSQPPEEVTAYALSSEIIKISWNPPPLFTLHGVLQGYKVIYKPVRKDEDETDANFVKSDGLEISLTELQKYTNYSLQVLAYTRKGEGVRSSPVYIRTLEDVPGRPAGIKASTRSNNSVVVSWRAPDRSNGVLTAYTIYYSNTSARAQEMKIDASPDLYMFELRDLEDNVNYWTRVTANTRMGEGESTQIVTVMPKNNAPARITSFSQEIVVSWQAVVVLPCSAVGDPTPSIMWSTSYGSIDSTDRYTVLNNGSLYMVAVIGTDADNYTCRAENAHGSDVITYSLSVQVDANTRSPPKAPILSLAAVTSSTIQVNWLSGSNGGSPILRFLLRYKKEHEGWQEVLLGAKNRSHTSTGLRCGTAFKFSITALNSIGRSQGSNVVATKTIGAPPIAPTPDELLKYVNTTSVDLDMRKWRREVCSVHFYSIVYQILGEDIWTEADNSISWNTTLHTVEDLHPATRYIMKVTAYSDAGTTECQLRFATLTYAGGTLQPLSVFHKNETYFYEKIQIMIPLCAAFIVLIILLVGVTLVCVRRRQIIRYKENSSNIRRDITAETSLMNDLDKRLNTEPESPADCRFNCPNVNLLISLQSDDNLSANNSQWCFHDTSKTNSDNASLERYEEDANINPYATFNELKLVFSENPTYHKAEPDSEDDSICLEKAMAQKAMQARGEPAKTTKYCSKPQGAQPTAAEQHSYDNQAVVLSPRKYASADQIHALFMMAPPRPQSAYSKNRSQGTRSTPSEKGSQRHSLISSVTTVSSSRDELMEAFENLNRNPPPPPVVYETEADSLSQPTDSSSTEPGICLFTESPPQPNERREASCEVPRYESPDESLEYKEQSPSMSRNEDSLEARGAPRRPPRPCSVQKMKENNATSHRAAAATAKSTSRPRCKEEVTYMFNDGDSPVRSHKPHSFEEKLRTAREERSTSVWRKGGRRTPHARTRYDTTLHTPGTADNKPLVASQVMSVQDESPEDEESVSLLDRFYRPVPARRRGDVQHQEDDEDNDYTENFTVV